MATAMDGGAVRHAMRSAHRRSSLLLTVAACLGIATLILVLMVGASMMFLHRGGEADAAGLIMFLLMLMAIVVAPLCAIATMALAIIGGVLRSRERKTSPAVSPAR